MTLPAFPTLSVIVPVYFNAPSLPMLAEKLAVVEKSLSEAGMNLELIFVDDGSGDDSLAVLQRLKAARPANKIIKLTRNFGAVHASKCGMHFVTGNCFLVLAADLQDPPDLISEMAARWRAGSKFTIATRISRDDPWASKCFAALFYWLLQRLVLPGYPSGGYDMALMDKALLPHMKNSSKNLYTPLLAYWLGYKPDIIPYHRAARAHGKSRWTMAKKMKAFLDVMLGFSVTPIRLISSLGLIVSLCSFGYGMVVVANAMLGTMPVRGFASIVALITFLLGLIIIMLGVIGEYLWRVFDEVNRRPEIVIDEVY